MENMKVSLNDFLEPFFLNEDEPIHLRGFKAKGDSDKAENRPRKWQTTRREFATNHALQNELKAANKTRGLYFVVNAGGNEDKDITRFTAFYVEDDNRSIEEQHARLDACPLLPSIRVETRKSVHAYWLIGSDCTADEWREIQARLIAYFNADEKIKNPSRVMRLPYFNHVHFDGNGYEYKRVKIAHFEPSRLYTVAQMQAAFPKAKTQPETKSEPKTMNTKEVFENHEDRHEELCRRIEAKGKRNSKGKIDCKGICHNGKGDTGLVYIPESSAVKCNNEPSCDYDHILEAFGLPSGHLPKKQKTEKESKPFFLIRTARQCLRDAASMPPSKRLFGDFIFESEVTILFSEPGNGKTVLVVQLGDGLGAGTSVCNFENESEPHKVLYFDFELSDKQFRNRYTDKDSKFEYGFDENFYRITIARYADIPERSFDTFVFNQIEQSIIETNARTLIVDNITWLNNELQEAKNAAAVMTRLVLFKMKYDLTLIVLAHTPKRDNTRPLTLNDLAGSRQLANFADSIIAIGKDSRDDSARYLKLLKVRSAENFYGESNIALLELEKVSGFLRFKANGFGHERECLKTPAVEETKELDEKILEIKKTQPNLSFQQIAAQLNTNKMRVKRVIDRNARNNGNTVTDVTPVTPVTDLEKSELAIKAMLKEVSKDQAALFELETQIEERAAIMEFDGRLSHEEANHQAEIITLSAWLKEQTENKNVREAA